MLRAMLVFCGVCLLANCASVPPNQGSGFPSIAERHLDVYSCPVFGNRDLPRELHVFAVIEGDPPNDMTAVSIFCSTGQSTEDNPGGRHGLSKVCRGGHVKMSVRNGTFSNPEPLTSAATPGWSGSVYRLDFAPSEDTDGTTLQIAVISLECVEDGRPIRPLPPAEPRPEQDSPSISI